MNQEERLDYLIRKLCTESGEYQNIKVPEGLMQGRPRLLRSLMNVRMPKPIDTEFLKIQDEYLKEEALAKGIVTLSDIPTIEKQYKSKSKYADRLSIWQGDITRLSVDCIVNAANSRMLGCFVPCHGCIDNAIHSAAGIQLREECAKLMQLQGHEEPTGSAKITKGYNLPARYVIHTVGPIVYSALTEENKKELASCYRSCLELADRYQLRSIAFCCISTGEFHFPNEIAARIAVDTVAGYLPESRIERIIFNVFRDEDYDIYKKICLDSSTCGI